MDSIIDHLIRIEEQAKTATRQIDAERSDLPKRIEASVAAVNERVSRETTAEIEALQKRIAVETQERCDAIQASFKRRAAEMNVLYAQQRSAWSEMILHEVIGR